jgi:hypothetical protein
VSIDSSIQSLSAAKGPWRTPFLATWDTGNYRPVI